jgi:hypothetical protein
MHRRGAFQYDAASGAASEHDMPGQGYEIDPALAEPNLLAFVRDYWQRTRGGRTMPGRMDIAPTDMKAHLPHILLVDVINDGEDFRYRLVGSQLQRYFDGNPTGKLMSETLAVFGADTVRDTLDAYRLAVVRGTPVRIRGTGAIYRQDLKYFDALLTPLSDDATRVNMIFGTFLFAWNQTLEKFRTGPNVAKLAEALAGK